MLRIRTYWRNSVLRTLLAVTVAGWSRPAPAYHLEEHLQLGRTAYEAVCQELLGTPIDPPLSPEAHRRLTEVACENYESRAIHYGQYVGLAADHIAKENLGILHGDLDAENLVTYLQLAIDDADHFFPGNLRRFEIEHDHALALAVKAASLSVVAAGWTQVRIRFWQAFYAAAFGDHFLQDAFAPGHGSFNRPASTPAASRTFHNTLNEEGLVLRDGEGRIWAAYGDGLLNLHTTGAQICFFDSKFTPGPSNGSREHSPGDADPSNTPIVGRLYRDAEVDQSDAVPVGHNRGAFLAEAAEQASVRDFILTFVTGSRSPPRERAVALRLPANCLGSAAKGCTTEQTILRRRATATAPGIYEKLANCAAITQTEADYRGREQALQSCSRTGAIDNCDTAAGALKAAGDALRATYASDLDSRNDLGVWIPLIAAMNPATLRYGWALSGIYQPILGSNDHLVGVAADFQSYALVGLWGPVVGYYSNVSDSGRADKGLLLGVTLGVPLGLKYGSVLSWDAYIRPTTYLPLDGDRRVGYVALPVGVQLGVQIVSVTLGLSAALSPNYAFKTGPDVSELGWRFGLETGLSLRYGFGLMGGGLKSAPPF